MILRLYAWLLRLYPSSFYDRFGSEMLEVFAQAWDRNRQSLVTTMMFCIREFAGLLVSISKEQWSERNHVMLRKFFRWYLIPFWLFALSLLIGVIFSWTNWGYVVKPSTTFRAIETVESISLVQFDEDYIPTALPLNEMPYLITPSFPPSQILSHIPSGQIPAKEVYPQLAERVSNALADEGIYLAQRPSYPLEPTFDFLECNPCLQMGLQPQPDGSFLQLIPLFESYGQPTGENSVLRFTPNDWQYYGFVMPAAYVVTGKASDGTPLVFVGLASAAIGNDRYHYYEYLFDASNDTLKIRDQLDYRFDIAGLEDYNVTTVTLTMFFPLMLAFLIWLVIIGVFAFIQRYLLKRPLMRQA